MEEIFVNFLVSLGAGIVTPIFQISSNKDVENKLTDYFSEALWDWVKVDNSRSSRYPISDYQSFLQEYVKDGVSESEEVEELLLLWQKRLLNDPACAAFLTNFKVDRVDTKFTSVGKNVLSIKDKIDLLHQKFDKINLGTQPDSTKLNFRDKKDLETLKELMEAFSFDFLHDFCIGDPKFINVQVVACYEVWSAYIHRPTFKIYNEELCTVIMDFYGDWKALIDFGVGYYSSNGQVDRYTFSGLEHDIFTDEEHEKIFYKIVGMRRRLHPKLKAMADYIQSHYEIDLNALALKFFREC